MTTHDALNAGRRDFPTAVIASLSTGVLLCKFSDMHEAAEFLMGHPIWTHHFADKNLWAEMQRTIAEQCRVELEEAAKLIQHKAGLPSVASLYVSAASRVGMLIAKIQPNPTRQ